MGGKFMKKLSFVLIALTMLVSIFVPQASANSNFTDVPETYSFYEEIMYLSGEEVINGFNDGTFKPDEKVTRAAAAAMIGRAIGLDGEQRATKFNDVNPSSFASGYIASAVEEGVIKGYTDGTFRPNNIVTRGEMAIFIARAFDLTEAPKVTFFKDVTSQVISASSIQVIHKAGIAGGYTDGTFRPYLDLNRAQFSAFLARALNPDFRLDFEEPEKQNLQVSFIDVGQGDSTLIITPYQRTILIDGGKRSEGDTVVQYLKEKGVTSIDLVVSTHPDADHIGGLIDVLEQFEVKKVLDSGIVHTSQTYMDYLTVINQKDIPVGIAYQGSKINIDPELDISILNDKNYYDDNNNGSIVLKMSHGEVDYLFTGDAGIEAEERMIAKHGNALNAEVLKVGHHGSNTSTSQAFVEAVNPVYGILSYGEGNSYGHPHEEVYNRLVDYGVDLISTVNGTIEMADDGDYIYIGQEQTSPNPEPTPEPTPEPSNGVYISDVDLDGETATVMNASGENVDISGWYLVSEEGNQRYDFPQGSTIEEGYYITVWSGPDAENRPPYYQLWTNGYIWNNSGDAALLYNAQGELVSEVR
jgi:competence protein ComEC